MKFLVHAVGSHGDVLPLIALSSELQLRGHTVHFFVDPYFVKHAQRAGLETTSIGDNIYLRTLQNPNINDTFKLHDVMSVACFQYAKLALPLMQSQLNKNNTTISICNTTAFTGRLLKDINNCPAITIHYAPSALRSSIKPPRMMPQNIDLGHAINKILWRAVDFTIIDPPYTRPFNIMRKKLGLEPIKYMFDEWIQNADLLIGFFPPWFAEQQADWPTHLQRTSFPLFDNGSGTLPKDVQDFLDSGDKPIAFTPGTFNTHSKKFFENSIKACQRMGKRAILITPFKDQIPFPLPKGIVHFDYVPFTELLPKLAAFVHHGGIGSTSQALAAGVPQLIFPMIVDQYDNSQRMIDLGVATEVLPKHYTPRKIAQSLVKLLNDKKVKCNCVHYANMLKEENGIKQTCDLILDTFIQKA